MQHRLAVGPLQVGGRRVSWGSPAKWLAVSSGEAAETHEYTVETGGVGPEDPEVGPPSQTARFTRCSR